mgnify:FL=1
MNFGFTTRFAPSPTGEMHLGNAYSALFAYKRADKSRGGKFLLRIEDIDSSRCKSKFEISILVDLEWLGISSDTTIRRQSEHLDDYALAVKKLKNQGLTYPCFCSRSDINAINNAPHKSRITVYPGTCRNLDRSEIVDKISVGKNYSLRLDVKESLNRLGKITWYDRKKGLQTVRPELFGDIIIARKDTPTSYHLAVTVDDHLQNINLVTRGDDLEPSTGIHRILQKLLGFSEPEYEHHKLIFDNDGERLSKRNKSATISSLRSSGIPSYQLIEALLDGNHERLLDLLDRTAE